MSGRQQLSGSSEHRAYQSRGVAVATDDATRRLSLTGTPFRSDDSPIPFVNYELGPDGLKAIRAVLPKGTLVYGVGGARISAQDGATVRLSTTRPRIACAVGRQRSCSPLRISQMPRDAWPR